MYFNFEGGLSACGDENGTPPFLSGIIAILIYHKAKNQKPALEANWGSKRNPLYQYKCTYDPLRGLLLYIVVVPVGGGSSSRPQMGCSCTKSCRVSAIFSGSRLAKAQTKAGGHVRQSPKAT
jgi:hypothetical protein